MDKLRVYYDRKGNTLSVWFADPTKEHVCEEADDDVVLVELKFSPKRAQISLPGTDLSIVGNACY
jgi:hypothetical protein